jgi:hypothetical protein
MIMLNTGPDGLLHTGGDASHKAAECPRKDAVVCFNCNQSGHKGFECPTKTNDKKCYKCKDALPMSSIELIT